MFLGKRGNILQQTSRGEKLFLLRCGYSLVRYWKKHTVWREFLGNTGMFSPLPLSLCLSAVWMPLAVNDFISNPLTAGWKREKMDADISVLCERGVALCRREMNENISNAIEIQIGCDG